MPRDPFRDRDRVEKCIVCSGADPRVRFGNVNGFDVVQCRSCGFVYCDSQPKKEELEEFYSFRHGLAQEAVSVDALKAARNFKDRKLFLRLIKRYCPHAVRACEIGCSYGYLLWGLKRAGLSVEGCELSTTTAQKGRTELGLDIFCGEFPPAEDPSYDVIIFRHSLEHGKNPQDILERSFRKTNEGGILIIVVPNIESFSAKLFGATWEWLDPPLHLFYFSSRTLTALLIQKGFKVVHTFSRKGDSRNFFLHAGRWAKMRMSRKPPMVLNDVAGDKTGNTRVLLRDIIHKTTDILSLVMLPLMMIFGYFGKGEELWIVAKKSQ